jgi:hypothetical protein
MCRDFSAKVALIALLFGLINVLLMYFISHPNPFSAIDRRSLISIKLSVYSISTLFFAIFSVFLTMMFSIMCSCEMIVDRLFIKYLLNNLLFSILCSALIAVMLISISIRVNKNELS